MSAQHDLENAYLSWRHWTQQEAAALELQDWAALARYQKAKAELQPLIRELTASADQECQHAGGNAKVAREKCRGIVDELIALETANQKALQRIQQHAAQRRTEVALAKRNVSRMQGCYTSSRRSHWHSYS